MDDGIDLAALLRRCRQRAGMGQQALAELSGLGVRTIRDLEVGRTVRPRRESVRLLADALGLDGVGRERLERAAGHGPRPPLVRLAPVPAPPGQLPPDLTDFTARAGHLAALRALLTAPRVAPAVAVLHGPPGAGKTALAVHSGHSFGAAFPDGHLFADLRGTDDRPRPATDVLAGFLHALGVEAGAIPDDLDGRAAAYRTGTAARRVLVVLDDAASEAQVRPLLPGGAGCATLVTSCARLAGLEAAATLPVGEMEPAEAAQLLAAVAGPARVAAEPWAADAIAERCGHLPLALRIAGARLAGRPHWRLTRLAALLAAEDRRLGELRAGDQDVRARFATSYRPLAPDARTAFRRIALLDGPDVALMAIAGAIGTGAVAAERLCEQLVEVHLLEPAGEDRDGRPRYRLHGLLRAFARERLREEERSPWPVGRPDARASSRPEPALGNGDPWLHAALGRRRLHADPVLDG